MFCIVSSSDQRYLFISFLAGKWQSFTLGNVSRMLSPKPDVDPHIFKLILIYLFNYYPLFHMCISSKHVSVNR